MTTEAIKTDALQVLTFDLHGETFALEAGLVREVLDLLPETGILAVAAEEALAPAVVHVDRFARVADDVPAAPPIPQFDGI